MIHLLGKKKKKRCRGREEEIMKVTGLGLLTVVILLLVVWLFVDYLIPILVFHYIYNLLENNL